MSDFDRDCWSTPQYIFNWLDDIYNFGVDLCANEDNHKVSRFISKEDDSLSQAWVNPSNTGFCNPPYSNIKPWIKKAIVEASRGFTTVMLIPSPNGESYYKDVFISASSLTFINGRIAFYNPAKRKEVKGNTRGSCVVEFSKKFNISTPLINHIDRDDIKREYG